MTVECALDSASSDRTSFGTLGSEPVWCSWWDESICEALTTTSIVCGEEDDCALGSDVGTDDHAAKFPLICESAVRAKVATWCSYGEIEEGMAEAGGSCTDGLVYCAPVGDKLAVTGLIEHWSSYPPTMYLEWAHLCV